MICFIVSIQKGANFKQNKGHTPCVICAPASTRRLRRGGRSEMKLKFHFPHSLDNSKERNGGRKGLEK